LIARRCKERQRRRCRQPDKKHQPPKLEQEFPDRGVTLTGPGRWARGNYDQPVGGKNLPILRADFSVRASK
jgi:hypothetical protein